MELNPEETRPHLFGQALAPSFLYHFPSLSSRIKFWRGLGGECSHRKKLVASSRPWEQTLSLSTEQHGVSAARRRPWHCSVAFRSCRKIPAKAGLV